jgi:Flp pilus assembly protein TadB
MAKRSVTDRTIRVVIILMACVASAAFAVATLGPTAAAVKMTVIAVGVLVVWLTMKVGRRRQADADAEDSEADTNSRDQRPIT